MTRRKRICLFAVHAILEELSKKYAEVKSCLNLIVQLRWHGTTFVTDHL
jgi:hypothetical protein